MRAQTDLPVIMPTDPYQSWIRHWSQLWTLPHLPQSLRIEFSLRIRRSLGRCYPSKGVIRLNQRLLDGPEEFLREVVCHEVAHIAVHLVHGNSRRPHGPEWAGFMRAAGYVPRARLPMECLPENVREAAAPKVTARSDRSRRRARTTRTSARKVARALLRGFLRTIQNQP